MTNSDGLIYGFEVHTGTIDVTLFNQIFMLEET